MHLKDLGAAVSFLTQIATLNKTIVKAEAERLVIEGALTSNAATMASSIAAAIPLIAGICAAIALVTVGIKAYKAAHPSLETLQKDAEAAKNEFQEMEKTVKETQDRIKELNELKEKNLLTSAESEELDYLEKQNEVYTHQLDLLKQIADYKEQQVIEKVNEDAMQELERFKPFSVLPDDFPGTNSQFFGGDLRRLNPYDVLMNAIEKYGEVQTEIDALVKSTDGKEEKELLQIKADIDAKNKELDHWRGILAENKEHLTTILGGLTDDDGIAYATSLLDQIESTGAFKSFTEESQKVQKSINDLSSDAQKALLAVAKGEKALYDGSGKLTEEGKEVVQWLEDIGLSADDAAIYLARWANEIDEVTVEPKINISSALSALTTLRDELALSQKDLKEFDSAMEGGEKGDVANAYKTAWGKATEGLKSGKNDTNALRAAAKLFFSPEQLAEMGYDLEVVGKKLNKGLFKALFSGDGDIGENFGNYLKKHADKYSEFVNVIQHKDGSFDLAISNFEGLAKAMGISTNFLMSLLDGLDAFGTQVMLDNTKLGEFKKSLQSYKKDALDEGKSDKDARKSAIENVINDLIAGGSDEFTTLATMRALKKQYSDFFDGYGDKTFTSLIDKALENKVSQGSENGEKSPEERLSELKSQYEQMIADLQSSIDGTGGLEIPVTLVLTSNEVEPGSDSDTQTGEQDSGAPHGMTRAEDKDQELWDKVNGDTEGAYDAGKRSATSFLQGIVDGVSGSRPFASFPQELEPFIGTDNNTEEAQKAGEEAGEAYVDGISGASFPPELEPFIGTDNNAVASYLDEQDAILKASLAEDLTDQYYELRDAVSEAQGVVDGFERDRENAFENGADTSYWDYFLTDAYTALKSAKDALAEFEAQYPEIAQEVQAGLNGIPDEQVTSVSVENDTAQGISEVQGALASIPEYKTVTISVVPGTIDMPTGIADGGRGGTNRMAAKAGGTKNAKGGRTLVNELGPELISENGRAYIAGGGAPTVVNLSKGAIVLDAEDTKKALSGKKHVDDVFGAAASGVRIQRGAVKKRSDYEYTDAGARRVSSSGSVANTGSDATLRGNTIKKKSSNSGGGGGGGGGGNTADNGKNKVDWIAVAVDRLTRAIDSLGKVFNSAFKTLGTRMEASNKEIAMIRDGFQMYQAGYNRYIQEANSVGLSEDIAALVRNGTIDIRSYDEDTKKKIDEYKQWYDKALDCQKAIDDLHESLAKLYKERFDIAQTDYENQLAQLEHQASMVEKSISMVEQKGYLGSASFYQQLASNEASSISKLRAELNDLTRYFNEAMNSGEIQKNSEAWYEMKASIASVEEAIADANIKLVEYQKNIRQINWSAFDFAHERFSQLTSEAEFLINLMKNDELFDDRGQLADAGMATVGMRVMNYNAYMAQADAYAKEMKRIQQELAKDPYDTELIKRREELLGLQQQSIISAEDEKDAVRSLVEEGISKELGALKDLIDAYKDSIDSAKDLYEYQKRVSEKTQDIAKIQKQLAAYTGDTSEENRARVQKLNEALKKTQEELKEVERDQSITDQKKLLDDLYDEYETLLNERLDNVDALMADMIAETNNNLVDIRESIDEITRAVGYSASGGMQSMLYGTYANYNNGFETFESVSGYLGDIYKAVDAMARASGAVKAYASGGLADYTGYAMLHGSKSHPELVLNASDTENLLAAAAMLRRVPILSALGDRGFNDVGGWSGGGRGTTIGSLYVTIPIDHVQDYNDMLSQMRDDPKFERLISVMTLDTAVGKSSFRKNSIKF